MINWKQASKVLNLEAPAVLKSLSIDRPELASSFQDEFGGPLQLGWPFSLPLELRQTHAAKVTLN